ncbi:MAG TPA: helix-turn-helix transcriptional regulator [Mycobacteriales bacterium]|jgi:DNA-binding CsgD family transcriptional regulator
MTAATAPPDVLDGSAPLPGGGPAGDLRAVFGDLMRLHAEAAGIQAEARHRVPHDLDERLAGLARGLGRAAGRLSSSYPSPHAVRPVGSVRPRHWQGWAALTPAELEVIRVVVAGRTNREAAALLFLSPHTVSSHLRHAYAKLGINSRVELVRAAVATDIPGQQL